MFLRDRQLSEFMCRELLYDYMMDKLDKQRKVAVKRHLESNRQTQSELQELQSALNFCENLSHIHLPMTCQEELIASQNRWTYFVRSISPNHWSAPIRLTAETSLIFLVVFTSAIWIPWGKVIPTLFESNESVELVHIERENSKGVSVKDVSFPSTFNEKTLLPRKDIDILSETPLQKGRVNLADSFSTKIHKVRGISQSSTEELPPLLQDDEERSLGNHATEAKISPVFLPTPIEREINFTDAKSMVPLIIRKVKELGGVKVGKISLGGERDGRHYFHFKMSQSGYDNFMGFLDDLRPVLIYKTPHRRVMPEEEIRFILWVGDTKN